MPPKASPLISQFFTIPDIAKELQVSEKSVRRWVKAGELIAHRVGNQIRIAPDDYTLFLRQRRGLK